MLRRFASTSHPYDEPHAFILPALHKHQSDLEIRMSTNNYLNRTPYSGITVLCFRVMTNSPRGYGQGREIEYYLPLSTSYRTTLFLFSSVKMFNHSHGISKRHAYPRPMHEKRRRAELCHCARSMAAACCMHEHSVLVSQQPHALRMSTPSQTLSLPLYTPVFRPRPAIDISSLASHRLPRRSLR